MGAKHYVDHEIRFLVYSVLFNSRVHGENAALARQLHRSEGAVSQQKVKIKNVMKGKVRDRKIERVLAEFAQKRKRTKKCIRRCVNRRGRLHGWGCGEDYGDSFCRSL